ncbi:MAG: hypothetical protein JNG84_10755 [Archangium sp.]|nr:hypothetical protein [Archangium sp.]
MKTSFLVVVTAVLGACGGTPPVVDEEGGLPSGPALAVVAGSEVVIVGPDGVVRGRYGFPPPVSPQLGFVVLSAPRAGRVAAVSYLDGPGEHSSQHQLVLDRGGRIIWEKRVTGRCGPVRLGDDGDFVSCNPSASSWTYHAVDGGTVEIPGVNVLADPLSGGLIPASVQRGDATLCGFWNVRTAAFEPWTHATCGSVFRLGASVVHMTVSGDKRAFIEETASGAHVVESPDFGSRTLILEVNEETHEVLLGATHSDTGKLDFDSLVRVDAQRVAHSVHVRPEVAVRRSPFTAGPAWPHLGPNGTLLLGQRDAYVGALFQTVNGTEWDRIGQGLVDIDGITSASRGGTTVVAGLRSTPRAMTEPFMFAWEQPLTGDSLQVITKEDGTVGLTPARINPFLAIPLTRDGRRLAYWNDDSLVLFDAREGTLTAVPSLADATGRGALAWIE